MSEDRVKSQFRLLSDVAQLVTKEVKILLPEENAFSLGMVQGEWNELLTTIQDDVFHDFLARYQRDLAANSLKPESFLESEDKGFIATLHYRIASNLLIWNSEINDLVLTFAKKISEESKTRTGIEISPKAKIGKRFVVDHGTGTVIGETCEIGEDCYILQCVVLGAARIGQNVSNTTGHGERRHPKLENHVQVCGFAKVFGAITIGNYAFIGPGAIITKDVRERCRVLLVNQLQINCNPDHKIVIYGVIPGTNNNTIEIHGQFDSSTVSDVVCINSNNDRQNWLKLIMITKNDNIMTFECEICSTEISIEQIKDVSLKIVFNTDDDVVVTHSKALENLLRKQLQYDSPK